MEAQLTRTEKLLRSLEVPGLILVPVVLALAAVFKVEAAGLLTVLVALLVVLLFFASFEASKPQLSQIMPTVVLAALAAAGRLLFAAIPSVKPVAAITIIAGSAFGKRCGFMVGALALVVSNMFLGQGPWTPWQMYSFGLIGYLAGVLAKHGAFDRPWLLYLYGFLAPLGYGFILNSWFIIGFVEPINLTTALAAYAAGLPGDLAHSISTVVFLLLLYAPWQRKLERIKAKYALFAE